MQAHLTTDAPPVRAELAKTRGQQQLLAAAARMEFPDKGFAAPIMTGAEGGGVSARTPAVIPMPQPAKKRTLPWRRWAAAAAILLALAGVSVPGYWMNRDYSDAVRTTADQRNASVAAQVRMQDALARIQKLPNEEMKQIEEVRSTERARQLKLNVVGPSTITAGAPTVYEIQTSDRNNVPVAVDLQARVVGADKQPIGSPIPVVRAETGKYTIVLPADLPMKPEAWPVLVVSASRDAGDQASVTEALDLSAPVYITHLETDKPMYQPGEVVYFRSLTPNAFQPEACRRRPAALPAHELVSALPAARSLNMQGATGLRNRPRRGAWAGRQKRCCGAGAGESRARPEAGRRRMALVCRVENTTASSNSIASSWSTATRNRKVLNKQPDFSRSTYGPGDEVAARCKATLVNGDPVRNQPVEATVPTLDDKKYKRPTARRCISCCTSTPTRSGHGGRLLQPAAAQQARRGVVGRQVPGRILPRRSPGRCRSC